MAYEDLSIITIPDIFSYNIFLSIIGLLFLFKYYISIHIIQLYNWIKAIFLSYKFKFVRNISISNLGEEQPFNEF